MVLLNALGPASPRRLRWHQMWKLRVQPLSELTYEPKVVQRAGRTSGILNLVFDQLVKRREIHMGTKKETAVLNFLNKFDGGE